MRAQASVPAEDVAEELARVLRRGEFHEPKSLLEQFLEWLGPLGGEGVDGLQTVVVSVFLVALVVLIVLAVRRFARARRGLAEEEGPAASVRSPAARLLELEAAAARARAAGDTRLALRLLFQALLVALGGRGDLEFRPAWTNRELVRRGKHVPGARALLDGLVRELEPKEFGTAEVEERDLERLEGLLAPHLAGVRRGA